MLLGAKCKVNCCILHVCIEANQTKVTLLEAQDSIDIKVLYLHIVLLKTQKFFNQLLFYIP